MTKKETLANEYVELKKQFDGEQFKAGLAQNQPLYLAKNFKVADLEQKIEAVRNALKAKAEREAQEAWYETEEGKAYKAEKEAARKMVFQQMMETRENAYKQTRKTVKLLLGEAWDVIHFSGGTMVIGIVKYYKEDGTPEGLFGHDFDVYFDRDWLKDEYRWEMNYGAMGSFNIGQDEQRTAFLVGMAKFASDQTMVPALRDYLHGVVKSLDALRDAGNKIRQELENPQIAA